MSQYYHHTDDHDDTGAIDYNINNYYASRYNNVNGL